MSEDQIVRRAVKSRNTNWANYIAKKLTNIGLQPNQISLASSLFAGIAGLCLVASREAMAREAFLWYFFAVLFIQGRLLCNLFDGMVAVEGGKKTNSGELFNDFPDRFSDVFIFVGAGYSVANIPLGIELGWITGILSIFTAYVRVLGGAMGVEQSFMGPMAKQHRMAVITVGLFCAMLLLYWGIDRELIFGSLAVIAFGSLITILRRTLNLIRTLEDPR